LKCISEEIISVSMGMNKFDLGGKKEERRKEIE
jgi:hypothetical protein